MTTSIQRNFDAVLGQDTNIFWAWLSDEQQRQALGQIGLVGKTKQRVPSKMDAMYLFTVKADGSLAVNIA